MNDRERAQIALILQRATKLACASLDERISTIYADHSAKGRLQSGSTIKAAVDAMNDVLSSLTNEMAQRVFDVVSDKSAFDEVRTSLQQVFEAYQERLLGVIRVASGRHGLEPIDRSVASAAQTLFDNWRTDFEAQVDILAFDFDSNPAETVEVAVSPVAPVRQKGGRPRADFWDDAWSAIAAALYDGSLIPKNQADVERAMSDWILSNGFNASESSVRARARRLWDLISTTD